MNDEVIIKIEGLKKHFPMGSGRFTALNGIDLSFGRGEFAGSDWSQRFRKDHPA